MLNDVRIGKKLGIGFGVATALLVMVSAVATIGLINASGGFDHYRETARDAVLLGQVQANLLEARLDVRKYMQSDDPAVHRRIQRSPRQGRRVFAEADKSIDEPQQRAKLEEMRVGFALYAKGVDDLKQLTEERVETVKRLAKLGETIGANLAVIREGVERGRECGGGSAQSASSTSACCSAGSMSSTSLTTMTKPISTRCRACSGTSSPRTSQRCAKAVTDGELLRRLDQVQKDSAGLCCGRGGHQEGGPGAQCHRRRRAQQGGNADDRGGRGGQAHDQGRAGCARAQGRVRQPDDHLHRALAWPCSG